MKPYFKSRAREVLSTWPLWFVWLWVLLEVSLGTPHAPKPW